MPATPLAASLFQLSILTRREYVADSNAAEFTGEPGNRRPRLLIGSGSLDILPAVENDINPKRQRGLQVPIPR